MSFKTNIFNKGRCLQSFWNGFN